MKIQIAKRIFILIWLHVYRNVFIFVSDIYFKVFHPMWPWKWMLCP